PVTSTRRASSLRTIDAKIVAAPRFVHRQCAFTRGFWPTTGVAMKLERSPLAVPFPEMPAIDGVTLRVARAQYKEWDRCDLTYAELAEGTAVAGVFTQNVCCSTEVELGRENAARGAARALIVNAGNSNAFTGYRGREAVEQIMEQVAQHLGCPREQVFVSSTGVIGVPLPKDKAREGVAAALNAAPC